jgi:hypothetical protein
MSPRGAVNWLRIMIMCRSEATFFTRGAVSWLRIMIMCQSEASCLPAGGFTLTHYHDSEPAHCSAGRHVASLWQIIMILSQRTAPLVDMWFYSDTLSWFWSSSLEWGHIFYPRSSELAQNHDNVSEWSIMSTRWAVSWLWIMIMCQSEATCLPAEQWAGYCTAGRHVASLWHIIMIQSQLTAPRVDMWLHSDTLSWFRTSSLLQG